eukprot:4925892-Prymnesium_polylepis.1
MWYTSLPRFCTRWAVLGTRSEGRRPVSDPAPRRMRMCLLTPACSRCRSARTENLRKRTLDEALGP